MEGQGEWQALDDRGVFNAIAIAYQSFAPDYDDKALTRKSFQIQTSPMEKSPQILTFVAMGNVAKRE
jgi:hypothetical protein